MKTVLFAGGGTLGPVTPLLAVADALRVLDPDMKFAWAGTDEGPERAVVESKEIPFWIIPVAKFPRYFSKKLLTLPFDFARANRVADDLIAHVKPRVIITAGGFTAVPVVRQAYLRGIPCLAHQLDAVPGLSNRILAKQCRYLTTSFPTPLEPFGRNVVIYHVPTPVRFTKEDLPTREAACEYFGLDANRPILFIVGGGTGATSLNEAMWEMEPMLPQDIQIIHLTGKGKMQRYDTERNGYILNEFFSEGMLPALAAADLVVSRAGVGAISEFAALSKAAILVPLPDSPQIRNAEELRDSVMVIHQDEPNWKHRLAETIKSLIADAELRERLGSALYEAFPTDRGEVIANMAMSVMV
jgi:UDP-N-acetylglucosamine--N-acetylmuramyl-(pentapeptide) pyrophosphoryl-undecaprenol N-acetylglucosamine transferase